MPLVAEQMDLVAAAGLRIIERDVGFREQFGDPAAMRAADESSSDRGTDLEATTVPEKRSAQHNDSLLQYVCDSGSVCRSAQDDREFVAAEPSDQAGIVEGPPQTPRDLAQACVSGRMAERIVEVLETIEVDQDECRRETMIQAVADDLAITGLENGAIDEPGERIGLSLPPQALHCLSVGGDVLFGAEYPQQIGRAHV